jgi:RNA-dependent RNA polymerase
MKNKYKPSYRSKTILGQLYDEVKKFKIHPRTNKEQNTVDTFSFPYETLVVNGSDAYMTEAVITKNEYELELKRVMRQYGIRTEAQLVSGYILKFTTKQYAKQAEMFDLRTGMSHAVKTIQDK